MAGRIGVVLFSWYKSSDLDVNAKSWRFFADLLNDMGMFLEILSPIHPQVKI